jgi:rhodanese-related sulfurtransferase
MGQTAIAFDGPAGFITATDLPAMKHVVLTLLVAAVVVSPAVADVAGAKKATAEAAQSANLSFPERPLFRNFTPQQFDLARTRNTNAVVLDVRTREEFVEGHIPGAVLIDFKAADFKQKVSQLDHDKLYLVHCAAGGRSAKAAELMGTLGFERVFNLEGGMKAWTAAGKPVEKNGTPKPAPLAPAAK